MSTDSESFRFGDVLRMDGLLAAFPERRVMFICRTASPDAQLVMLIKKDPTEDTALFSIRNSKIGDIFNITARVWTWETVE